MTLTRHEKPLEQWLEKELDAALFARKDGLAAQCGWDLVYHTFRSKGSLAGYPDRHLVRRPRSVFVELKTHARDSKPSAQQIRWLSELAASGHEVFLWRPLDLEDAGRVLAARQRPTGAPVASAWLPTGHRVDGTV